MSATGLLNALASGSWLTRERMWLASCAITVAFLIAYSLQVLTAHGAVDSMGRPLGTDFSNVYAAGTYVLEGRPEAPFDPALQYQREQAIFGADTPFYGWHYPPFFLFVAALLALMPYGLALAIWQATTFALYLVAIRAILNEGWNSGRATEHTDATDPLWLSLAIGFPAVFVNLGHGHNGFLSAALLGGAFVLLDRRPIAAGVLLGLLAYKPQFGLLMPFLLAATGRWRTFAAAGATVLLLCIMTTIAFGWPIWDAMLASTHFTRVVVLEAGETGWHKIQSVFSWVRMWGGSVPLAYAVQGATVAVLGAASIWLWRGAARYALMASAACVLAILATPYSLDYDMMALAPAIAFFAVDGLRRGFGPWEKSALAALWLVPLVARSFAQATLIPLGVITMICVYAMIIRRAQIESGSAAIPPTPIAHGWVNPRDR